MTRIISFDFGDNLRACDRSNFGTLSCNSLSEEYEILRLTMALSSLGILVGGIPLSSRLLGLKTISFGDERVIVKNAIIEIFLCKKPTSVDRIGG